MKDLSLNLYGWAALLAVLLGGICLGFAGLLNVYLLTGIFGNFLGRLLYIGIGVGAGYLSYSLYQQNFKKV